MKFCNTKIKTKLWLKVRLFSRYDTAVRERDELELELNNLRTNVDDCTIGRVDLERKLVSLREELDFDNMAHIEVG